MGLKSLHQGITTGVRGAEVIAFSFRTNAASAPDRIRDGAGNVVASVTSPAAGRYTVTLNQPRPVQMVAAVTELHRATAATTDLRSFVVRDSYNASTGTFEIDVLADDAAPAVDTNPTDDDVISFIGVFIRAGLNSIKQS
jgi:hypothetical protein